MDQFQAFNPDSTSAFGDYYDPRDDPREPTMINKYDGRVNYCGEGQHGPPPRATNAQRPLHKPHQGQCPCAVCAGYTKSTWDTTADYDHQYQQGTNFRHTNQCPATHRGVHDTRVPPLRRAWGTEQMTDGGNTSDTTLSGKILAQLPPAPDMNQSQIFWLFVMVVIVTTMVNLICAVQIRALGREVHKLRRGQQGIIPGIF